MTSHLILSYLLLLIGSLMIHLSTAIESPNTRVLQHPWERHVDLNPFPSLAELEERTSIEQIDDVLDQVTSTDGGIIIQQYRPKPSFLWRRWFGTVIYDAWPRVVLNMAWTTAFCVWVRYQTHGDCQVFNMNHMGGDHHQSLVSAFTIADKLWSTLMSFTTFLLTFFVGQAYSFWKSFIDLGRSIQGSFNTIPFLLTTHASRNPKTGRYTPEAELFLQDIGKQLKLFHLLHWASQARRFRVLLTDKGWDQMVARGLVSEDERRRLHSINVGPTQKQVCVLQRMVVDTQKAMGDKKIIGVQYATLQKKLLEEFSKVRGTTSTVPDLIAGRMPLAYVHFVQILVDTFLLSTPIAKYSDMGIFSVLMIGILTLFFHGLLILAKVFLDPLDNEDFCEGCVYLDLAVLLRESNGGIDKYITGAGII
ncbi:unnamed protein product [Cylindrotheca closterium]|uniref:Uncharacterized protein n=1 Tax=Cylindrotheca closterium TaxID=2856 RepID=A0AAD2GBD3_9STRA|nr:unnamed protein product [Cylindrotheca closterium]